MGGKLPVSRRKIKALVVIAVAIAAFLINRFSGPEEKVKETGSAGGVSVSYVFDGDTIELSGGERVRYAGIDTPERDRPYYEKAKRRNSELLKAGETKIVVCKESPTDKYGRTLAWVYAGGVDVSAELLREGLARTLSIPPCGLVKYEEYKALEREARRKRLGIWSVK